MAWEYVGGTTGTGTATGYAVSLNGTLTGGIASSPAVGDLVVVMSAFGNTAASAPAITGNNSGAYAGIGTAIHANDTWDTEVRPFYKVMGATPDTSLSVTRTNSAVYGGATVVQVWRGVDTASPFIGTTQTSGTNGCVINPPAYNPAVADALIIAGGAGTMAATSSAYTAFSGMSNFITAKGDGSTSDTAAAMASFLYAGASYDPPAVSGGTTSTSSSWGGFTFAFRLAPVVASGDLIASETGDDTFAATGTVSDAGIAGDFAASETGSDTMEAAGTVAWVPVAGEMAANEQGEDTAALSGRVIVAGTLSATETGLDTAELTGGVIVSGTLAVTETGSDTLSAAGAVLVAGALVATESGADTSAMSGAVRIAGALAVSETGQDVLVATGGSLQSPVVGTLSATEAGDDTLTATGRILLSGALAGFEAGSDTASLSGQIIVTGIFAAVDAGFDGFFAEGSLTNPISNGEMLAPESGDDTFAEPGYFEPGYIDDGFVSPTGYVLVQGALAGVESGIDRFIAYQTTPVIIPARTVMGAARTNVINAGARIQSIKAGSRTSQVKP